MAGDNDVIARVNAAGAAAVKEIRASSSLDDLEKLRVRFLGKSGEITLLSRSMGQVAPEARPAVGKAVNEAKNAAQSALDERKADQTDQQFVYTTRKKAIGPFKRELWDLATKDEILAAQATKIGFLFRELGVVGTRTTVEAHVRPVELHRPAPAEIASAGEAAPAR